MTNTKDDSYICPHCKTDVPPDDDFCTQCGEIFDENIPCTRHAEKTSIGVCVICLRPFCADCGGRVQDRFLCDEHDMLEIYEGMVRVFGTSDVVQIQFAKSSLETAGLHPFIFSRKASPISVGGPDYTLFNASGEYDGHIINEFKLMIPCQEFMDAQKTLKELEITG